MPSRVRSGTLPAPSRQAAKQPHRSAAAGLPAACSPQSPSIPGITGQTFPSFAGLVALLGPVLGIAFGFDAISCERSEGTLPRLVSQPIHRDDVINGKFVAGLAVITMILGAVILMLSGVGIIRLGIVPDADVALRLLTWFFVAAFTWRSGWPWRRSRRSSSGVRRQRPSWSSPSGSCSPSSAARS